MQALEQLLMTSTREISPEEANGAQGKKCTGNPVLRTSNAPLARSYAQGYHAEITSILIRP